MNKQYHTNIKFCGGCNPEIDRGRVVRRFKELLDKNPLKEKIIFDNGNDILIMVNGCPHACLAENKTQMDNFSAVISMRGRMIEFNAAAEDDLPEILLKIIKQIIN